MKKIIFILLLVSSHLFCESYQKMKNIVEKINNENLDRDTRIDYTEDFIKMVTLYLKTSETISNQYLISISPDNISIFDEKLNDEYSVKVIRYRANSNLFGTAEGTWIFLQIYNKNLSIAMILLPNEPVVPLYLLHKKVNNEIFLVLCGYSTIYRPMPLFFSFWQLKDNEIIKNTQAQIFELGKTLEMNQHGNFLSINAVDYSEITLEKFNDNIQIVDENNEIVDEFQINSSGNLESISYVTFDKIIKSYKTYNDLTSIIKKLENLNMENILKEKPRSFTDAQYVSVLNDYAYFLSETDRYKEAIPIFERVIELSPNRVVAYLNLGDCYYKDYKKNKKQSDKEKVVENYKKYVSLLKKDAKIPDRVKSIIDYRVETYNDEEHIKIKLENYFFNLEGYHVAFYEKNNDIEKYICKINKNNFDLLTSFVITVKPIENPKTTNINSILTFINNNYKKYTSASIYLDILGDSEITKLFIVREREVTHYILGYKDSWFLLESQNAILELMLFDTYNNYKADNKPNYIFENLIINCGKSYKATLEKTSTSNDNSIHYKITQEKNEAIFIGKITKNKENFDFILKDINGDILLKLSTVENSIDEIVKFEDMNMDGYIDIAFLSEPNGWIGDYELYTWNNERENFEKVKGVQLSHFEVYDRYIRNWKKGGYDKILQTFIWKGNSLIKISEEEIGNTDE